MEVVQFFYSSRSRFVWQYCHHNWKPALCCSLKVLLQYKIHESINIHWSKISQTVQAILVKIVAWTFLHIINFLTCFYLGRLEYVEHDKFGVCYMCVCFLTISKILMAISQINEPIPGMFVLIWMYFSWGFQIRSSNSTILTFFTKCVKYFTCLLLTPASW